MPSVLDELACLGRLDSNQRPDALEAPALPTALRLIFLCRFVLARGFEQSLHCRLTVIDKDDGNGRPAPPREQKAHHRMNPTRSRSRHQNSVPVSFETFAPNQKPPRPRKRHQNQNHQPSPHTYRDSTPETLHKTQPDRSRNDDTDPNRGHDERSSKQQPDEHPKKH